MDKEDVAELEPVEAVKDEESEVEETEQEPEAEGETEEVELETDDDAEEDEPAGLVVSIGDEEEAEETPVIRTVRQKNREQAKRIKELEERLSQASPPAQATELGPKPKIEDHDYDAGAFETALESWIAQKAKVDAEKAEREATSQKQQAEYSKKLESYNAAKAQLNVKDFSDAEDAVKSALSLEQQGVIVALSKDPALIIYALGKNPDTSERLAKSTDLVAFSYELAKIETSMKVTGTKKPAPEKRVRGGNVPVVSGEKQLERLEAEADRTGDRTAVQAYKRQLSQNKG